MPGAAGSIPYAPAIANRWLRYRACDVTTSNKVQWHQMTSRLISVLRQFLQRRVVKT